MQALSRDRGPVGASSLRTSFEAARGKLIRPVRILPDWGLAVRDPTDPDDRSLARPV
jgi:hypothetical protein